MEGLHRLLDQCHAIEFGPVGKPQADHVITPIAALSGKVLDQLNAALGPKRHQAARVQRARDLARSEMNNLDRSIEDKAGRDIEDKAVAEQRAVKRGKAPV